MVAWTPAPKVETLPIADRNKEGHPVLCIIIEEAHGEVATGIGTMDLLLRLTIVWRIAIVEIITARMVRRVSSNEEAVGAGIVPDDKEAVEIVTRVVLQEAVVAEEVPQRVVVAVAAEGEETIDEEETTDMMTVEVAAVEVEGMIGEEEVAVIDEVTAEGEEEAEVGVAVKSKKRRNPGKQR